MDAAKTSRRSGAKAGSKTGAKTAAKTGGATTKAEPPARRGGVVRAGALVPALTGRVMRARGFIKAEIVTRWDTVVGEDLASITRPVAVRFPRGKRAGATLVVRAAPATATVLQHRAPTVVERVNVYFGYGAVARLSIEQGPLPARPAPPPGGPFREPNPEAMARVAERLAALGAPVSAAVPSAPWAAPSALPAGRAGSAAPAQADGVRPRRPVAAVPLATALDTLADRVKASDPDRRDTPEAPGIPAPSGPGPSGLAARDAAPGDAAPGDAERTGDRDCQDPGRPGAATAQAGPVGGVAGRDRRGSSAAPAPVRSLPSPSSPGAPTPPPVGEASSLRTALLRLGGRVYGDPPGDGGPTGANDPPAEGA
ncbi:DUF721 domain-containing protein [Rhodothalassium salexigens]|nr:DUF721 domain-containing protein [Rhodothalassium salexigens]MBB4211915.1 hypothetical protein [Rhodothalassium salexigens DSM 2132]